MELSLLLAKCIGLYCLILSISVLLNYSRIPLIVEEFMQSDATIYLASIIALIIGILILTIHPVITDDWRVIITLFGWSAFIIGIVHLLVPELALRIIAFVADYRLLFSLFSLGVLACSLILLNEGYDIMSKFQ